MLSPLSLRATSDWMLHPLRWGFHCMLDLFDTPGDPRVQRSMIEVAAGPQMLRAFRFEPPAPRGPLLLFLHGGGWVLGGGTAHPGLLDQIALASGCTVLSLDYPSAPGRPIIAAFAQAEAALATLLAEAPVILLGESAGGAMAALLAQRCAGDARLRGQVLVCPIIDLVRAPPHLFTDRWDDWILRQGVAMLQPVWFNDRAAELQHVSPLARPVPPGLAPALIVTGGLDPLHPDGVCYAQALSAAGIAAQHDVFDGMPHGFFTLGRLFSDSARAVALIGDWTRALE